MPPPSLVLLALCAMVLLCASTADGGYSAPMQWGVFSACMAGRGGLLLATRSGRCASQRMLYQYRRMQKVNCIRCDKYFHCLANYQAVKCGRFGNYIAKVISDCRERSQPGNRADMLADQAANRHGRSGRSCNKYLRPYRCYFNPRNGKCKR